jgi:outer membrane protein assembly complex protein YaeT
VTSIGPILVRAGLAAALAVLCGCAALWPDRGPSDVRLVFEGLEAEPAAAIKERVAHLFAGFAGLSRPEPVLDDAAFEAELALDSLGFRDPRVEARLERPEDAPPLVRFTVQSGPRTRLGRVDLDGLPPQDQRDALLVVRDAGLSTWFSQRAAAAAGESLADWYALRGYARVVVSAPDVRFAAEGGTADVGFRIAPGPLFLLRDVLVEAEIEPWPEHVPREAVRMALVDLVGRPWSTRVSRLARGRVLGVLAEHGHPDARVDPLAGEPDPDGVVLRFTVRPGPRIRVGEVRSTGAVTTSASFFERRVALEPGAWFRRSDLTHSLRDLARSGIFDSVDVEFVPAPAPDDAPGEETRDVVFALEEAASREFHIEPGYGSYERLRVGFGAWQKNLFGTGRILDLDVSLAQLAQSADLSLIDPWILGSDATAIANVFWNRRIEPSFDVREHGLELGASWRLSKSWGVRARWQYRQSDTSDVAADDPALDEDFGVSEVSFEPTWDERDRFDDPRSGHLSRGGLDLSSSALGSEVEFARLRLEHARFLSIASRTTLAAFASVGVIAPIGSTVEIPIQERFFNGGENSVRSFRESQLGPRDAGGDPIGGESRIVLSLELRQRLGKRIQVAAFADAGTVELSHRDTFAFGDPGFALGAGVRYMLPIGPIRLDAAVNPDPVPYEADGALHLSVGFSF